MGYPPAIHVYTSEKVLEEVRAFLRQELLEIERAITYSVGRTTVEHLVAERNALSRVLKFLSILERRA